LKDRSTNEIIERAMSIISITRRICDCTLLLALVSPAVAAVRP
jgi:hypothetical protein